MEVRRISVALKVRAQHQADEIAHDDTRRQISFAEWDREADEVGGGLAAAGLAPVEESWTPRTPFDRSLAVQLSALLQGAPVLETGAGHDAGVLSQAGIPTAMLFVRNPTGVSHSPEEHADEADCHAGVEALSSVVRALAGHVWPAA